jgi:C4-dicarboxylate-specific signal transduction histidine kinase
MSVHPADTWRHSAYARYAVALLAATAAIWATAELQSVSPHVPGLPLLFCAAIVSAWFGGLGPGILAALISSAAIALNLIPPPSPGNSLGSELPRFLTFSIAVLFVSWISGRQRQAEGQLRQARDELEEKVAERTAELRRANGELQAEIAEREAAEEAAQRLEAELTHVSRLTLMGELTASIAHEVNQPLGAIMNYANACRRLLAADSPDKLQVDQALAAIAEDAHRASDVIARIRALSKKKPAEKAPAGVKALIDDVVAIARHKLQARGIAIRVDLDGALPPLPIDRVQIQQVLLNLLMNGMEAMDAAAPGERIIDISARSARHDGEFAVVLAVRDRGAGIGPADQDRLFEAFYSTKASGMGLGLAISRSLVESHGGRLLLVPTEGPGATFQVVLPATEPAHS